MPAVARHTTRLAALRSANPPHIWEPGLPCTDPANDPDLWHSQNNVEVAQAQDLCRICRFVDDCASWATATRQIHGVWGATSVTDRKRARAGTAA